MGEAGTGTKHGEGYGMRNEADKSPGDNEPRRRERRPMTQIARRLRTDLTPAEARLWEIVRNRRCGGLRFLRQHDMGHFVLDFYCASVSVALEIDGPIHDRPDVAAIDRDREDLLRDECGVRFVRLSNAFVLSATDAELRDYLSQAIASFAPVSLVTPTRSPFSPTP